MSQRGPLYNELTVSPPRLLFDDFELRLDSSELLRSGSPVKLQLQPARVLEVLAARSGQVVTREQIRRLVWGDAFLDFDNNLNFCILQIRKALGDSATAPRYVETVPKRGYRFLRPARIEPAPSGPGKTVQRSAAGHELYLQGLYFVHHWDWDRAEGCLRDAITLDPQNAPAHAALARVRCEKAETGQDLDIAQAAARRALELDPGLAEGHAVLGVSLLLGHDWAGAGRELREALALNPGLAEAHHWQALHLSFLGRHDEAVSSIARALALAPASMLVGADHAWVYYLARRYEEAIRQARNTLKLLPIHQGPLPSPAEAGREWSYRFLLQSARESGDEEAALHAARELARDAGPFRSLRELWEWERERTQGQPPSFEAARVAAILGERERALDLLGQLCRQKAYWQILSIGVEPAFIPLHSDPRFPRILDGLELPRDAPARS